MTIVTEYRLKCDYCGNVSPVLTVPPMYPPASQLPTGWIGEGGIMYGVSDSFTPNTQDYVYHFCCEAHCAAWLAERETKTA